MLNPTSILEKKNVFVFLSIFREFFNVFVYLSVFCLFFYCVIIPVCLPTIPCIILLLTSFLMPSLIVGYRPTHSHLNLQQVQNLQYQIYGLYFPMCCMKSNCTFWDKGVKHVSPSVKVFSWYLRWYSTASKRLYSLRTHKRQIVSSYDVVFDEIFSSDLTYMSQPY